METAELPAITQLFLPCRGIESATSEYPGIVQYDSPSSGDSYDRAVALTRYAQEYPGVENIVISGDRSFMMAESERPDRSEARAVYSTTRGLIPGFKAQLDEGSKSTYGNFAKSILTGLLDPEQATGVVVHRDHAARVLKAGRLAMPNARLVPIYADNPNRKVQQRSGRNDRIASALYSIAMFGVKAGDVEKIQERDETLQRYVLGAIRRVKNIVGIIMPKSNK